jgi:membrane peptidoglycan carboxypeptidase
MFPPPQQRDWRYYLFVAIASTPALAAILFIFTYFRYARLIDRKLAEGPFSATADIYAAHPPLLVMNLSDRNRENRRLARYDEIPKVLIDAVLAVEDKRFFRHNGFD